MYLKVTGPFALFARPEIRAERISYDFMTPSAAQRIKGNLLEAANALCDP